MPADSAAMPPKRGRPVLPCEDEARQVRGEPVPLQSVTTWPDLRVSVTRFRGPMIAVDDAAEHLLAPHPRVKRYDDRLVMIGWPLLTGLMRPMIVVMSGHALPAGAHRAPGPDPLPGLPPTPHRPLRYPRVRVDLPGRLQPQPLAPQVLRGCTRHATHTACSAHMPAPALRHYVAPSGSTNSSRPAWTLRRDTRD